MRIMHSIDFLSTVVERAGSIETEALKETSVETSSVKNFFFTSSHDLMMGENPNNP